MPGRSGPRGRTTASNRNRPWYERDGGARLVHDKALVRKHYPGLDHYVDDYARRVWLEGAITLRTESGIPTRIGARVEFPDRYPSQEPRVFETTGLFPCAPDRHLLPDGRCCLWLRPESRWDPNDLDGLLRFLDETALFFERQLIHDLYPDAPWPGGERGHGELGYAEYVLELLGNDERLLSALAPALAGVYKVGRNAPCPCQSGRKYKKCCLNRIEDIGRRVGWAVLGRALRGWLARAEG